MCEGGRIRHHLKNNLETPNNLVLFVGYCAQHTLGSRLINGDSPVKIFGDEYAVKAQVERLDAFSGHADKHELKEFVKNLTSEIKQAYVVHGEEDQSLAFAETLRGLLPTAKVEVPEYGKKVAI